MKKIFLFSVVALIAALTFMSCDSEELLLTDRNNSAKIVPIDDDPIRTTLPVVVTSNILTTQQLFMAGGQEKKVASFKIQANAALEFKGVYLKINGVSGFTNAPINLFNFKLKDATTGNILALESARFTQTNIADIVKFELPFPSLQIALGTTKTFDVFATATTIYDATASGQFNVTLATTFNDPAVIDDYKGLRLLKVSDGSIVTNASVTNATIGKNCYLVSSYPLIAKQADGNSIDLVTIRIANPGSTNLTVTSLQYLANAQVSADIAKPFTLYQGGSILSTGTLVSGNTSGTINFNYPITIAGGDVVQFKISLNAPFTNTSTNPVAGNRVFKITNLNWSQVYANGQSSPFGLVSTGYLTSCGFPITTSY